MHKSKIYRGGGVVEKEDSTPVRDRNITKWTFIINRVKGYIVPYFNNIFFTHEIVS